MVPQIDYTALATQMLPSAQRLPNFEAMTSALLSQSARCYSIFQEYMNTQPAATVWAVGTDYIGIGTRVWYQFGIYESLLASNLGNVPSTTPAAWILRNQFAVGAVQRTMYRPSCIGLTWALNDYFSIQIAAASLPGFKQPPWEPPYDFGTGSGSGYSTIYVLPDVPAYPSFLIGLTESTSDSVGTTSVEV